MWTEHRFEYLCAIFGIRIVPSSWYCVCTRNFIFMCVWRNSRETQVLPDTCSSFLFVSFEYHSAKIGFVGIGRLGVKCSPREPGSNLAEAYGCFENLKILRKNSHGKTSSYIWTYLFQHHYLHAYFLPSFLPFFLSSFLPYFLTYLFAYLRIYVLKYLLYGTTALEELWPPSNEGFFIWFNFSYLFSTRGRMMGDQHHH